MHVLVRDTHIVYHAAIIPSVDDRFRYAKAILRGGCINMGRLSGKTAIITGAGQGLGLAIAELFAKEGAKVVGTGRHVEKVEKAFAAVKAEHPDYQMTAMQHDVASKEEREKIAKDTAELYGGVDIVVNNAAIMAMKGILEASPEEFLNVYKTNCVAVLLSMKSCLRCAKWRQSGESTFPIPQNKWQGWNRKRIPGSCCACCVKPSHRLFARRCGRSF